MVVVHKSLWDEPQVQELREKGHGVYQLDGEADLILSPTAWRMTPQLLSYVGDAVKAARLARYGLGKPTKKGVSGIDTATGHDLELSEAGRPDD